MSASHDEASTGDPATWGMRRPIRLRVSSWPARRQQVTEPVARTAMLVDDEAAVSDNAVVPPGRRGGEGPGQMPDAMAGRAEDAVAPVGVEMARTVSLVTLGRYDEAMTFFDLAVQHDPSPPAGPANGPNAALRTGFDDDLDARA